MSKVLHLASDITTLAKIRMTLRERMSKSRLCDGSTSVRDLEAVYRRLWHRYCNGDMPSLSRRRLSEKLGQRNSIEERRGDMNSKEHHFNSMSVPNGLDCTVAHMSSLTSEGRNDVSTGKPSKQNPSQPS